MFDCDVAVPESLSELEILLAQSGSRLIAGGTDLMPRFQRSPAAVPTNLIDMSRLSELTFIRENNGFIEIGALTTHAAMASSNLLLQYAPALALACSEIGSPQTRARGTLGGNLVNASPAADTVPPLLCLKAAVLLVSAAKRRSVSLDEFSKAPGQTCLHSGEYVHSVSFARPVGRWGAAGLKLGRRSGMSIAVVSASVLLELDSNGFMRIVRIALGSVAPTAVRSVHAENVLLGQKPSAELFKHAAEAALEDIDPISDVRASADYRRHSARVLLARALDSAFRQAESRAA